MQPLAFRSSREITTEKDKKDIHKRIEKANTDYNSVIATAKKCLETPQFKDYAKQFEASAQEFVDLMLDLPSQDPVRFAFEIDNIRQKLKSMRALGVAVNKMATIEPRPTSPKKDPAAS